MTKDRIKDLPKPITWPRVSYKRVPRQHRSHEPQNIVNDCRIPLTTVDADKEHNVPEFLAQIDLLRLLVATIREFTQDVTEIHKRMMEPLADHKLGQELDDKTEDIKKLAYEISTKLKKLEQVHQDQHDIKGSAQWRITEFQIFTIIREFRDIMNQYNQEYCAHRDRSGIRKTDDELEEIIENGIQGRNTLSIVVDVKKIKETAMFIEERHREIQKLENSIKELHGMFADLASLVSAQGEMIDNIQQSVAKTADYTGKAKIELDEVVVNDRCDRKKKIILCIIVIVIILILILIFAAYHTIQKNILGR
ncbi:unnamed protein product [Rotaria sp. Silwood2]|nr:unnamed protein product [Rotaria sp. Silwood2]